MKFDSHKNHHTSDEHKNDKSREHSPCAHGECSDDKCTYNGRCHRGHEEQHDCHDHSNCSRPSGHDRHGRHGERGHGGLGSRGRHGAHRGHGRHGMHGDQTAQHFGSRRRMSSEDLQLIIVYLLENTPKHGYELIKELQAETHNFYAPSPGMVYPVLTFLEESDLATNTSEGNKKCYSLTSEGHAYLEIHRKQAEEILTYLKETGLRIKQMQETYNEEQNSDSRNEPLFMLFHSLKDAFRQKNKTASVEDKEKIREFLQKALDDINKI